MRFVTLFAAAVVAAIAISSVPALAQQASDSSARQSAATTASRELYHVHIAKAAPGKLREMIDAYVNQPDNPNASAPPLILRHVEGDDWDLLVLQPLGKEERVAANAPTAAERQFIQRIRPLSAMHSDTFAIGPAWAETRAALAGEPPQTVVATSGSTASRDNPVYIVSTYRAVPGHRDQLEQVLRRIAALDPGRYITLQHMEGAAWDLISVERYPSWNALAESESTPDMQVLRAQGFTSADGPSLELREHMAEHHDTLAVRVERPVK